jgi:hypothetical protein
MLVFASLACDDIPAVPMVDAVMVGDEMGTAYARVVNVSDTASSNGLTTVIYETKDYGETWQRIAAEPATMKGKIPRAEDLAMIGEKLMDRATNEEWWSFPRSGFRSFFHADTGGIRFVLPYGSVSNSSGDGRLFVAMGTEGVLVAKFDRATNGWGEWSLKTTGIDAINPIKLTISEPTSIALVVVLALLAPPLVIIHQRLLKWVWSYIAQDHDANVWALRTTLIITSFAILAIIIWLTDARTDFYPVLAVMTVIVVLAGLLAALLLSRYASAGVRLRVVIFTVVVSLIIPAALSVGTGAVLTSWPLVILIVWGFSTYRRVYRREYDLYLHKANHPRPRWTIDRLALETVLLGAIMVGLFLGMMGYASDVLYEWFGGNLSNIVMLALGAFYAFFAIRALKWYIDGVAAKLLDYNRSVDDPPLSVNLLGWNGHLRVASVWWLGALILAGFTFFVQATAYSWFQNLAV